LSPEEQRRKTDMNLDKDIAEQIQQATGGLNR